MPAEWMLQLFVVLLVFVRGTVVVFRQRFQQRTAERLMELAMQGGHDVNIVVRGGATQWSFELTSNDQLRGEVLPRRDGGAGVQR